MRYFDFGTHDCARSRAFFRDSFGVRAPLFPECPSPSLASLALQGHARPRRAMPRLASPRQALPCRETMPRAFFFNWGAPLEPLPWPCRRNFGNRQGLHRPTRPENSLETPLLSTTYLALRAHSVPSTLPGPAAAIHVRFSPSNRSPRLGWARRL